MSSLSLWMVIGLSMVLPKEFFSTAQLVYPLITRDKVYAKMRLMKQRGREHEAL